MMVMMRNDEEAFSLHIYNFIRHSKRQDNGPSYVCDPGLVALNEAKVLSGARQLQAASLSDEGIPMFRLGETWHTTACNSAPNLLHAFTSRNPRGAFPPRNDY